MAGFEGAVSLIGLDGMSFLKGFIGGSKEGRVGMIGIALVIVGFVMSLMIRGSWIEGTTREGTLKATFSGRERGRGTSSTASGADDVPISIDGVCKELEAELEADATFSGTSR